MIKSLDDKVIKSENNEYIYDTSDILRPLPTFLNNFHTIEYKSVPGYDIDDELQHYLSENKQEILLRDVIVYDEELNLADEISIITKRSYEDSHGLTQTNYFFYNVVDYEKGLSHKGVPTKESKYGTMLPPFKYLKNSSYYAESLRMAYISELGGLEAVQGKFLIDINGPELVIPCFPIKAWFEYDDVVHARYPRFSDGKIYNTKKIGIEHTYLL